MPQNMLHDDVDSAQTAFDVIVLSRSLKDLIFILRNQQQIDSHQTSSI
jgi:hypothetical protein